MNVIGLQVGSYRIVSELGSGAMATVYAAEHVLVGRRAAVKLIKAEHAQSESLSKRFLDEARAISAIGHPNVVEVTDVGMLEGRRYILMEMLEGETLEERLRRGYRLDEQSALQIALQLSDALAAAHDRGIVHRDIKPDNIFLVSRGGRDDFVKLLDFGIAKLERQDELRGSPSSTMPDTIVGTPQYMSPEQGMCEETLDHRSDIYSLGLVLYRMLTGELPFVVHGQALVRYILAHINQVPKPPREYLPELSERLESAILRALAKKPEERFEDMRAFGRAIAPDHDVLHAIATSPFPAPVSVPASAVVDGALASQVGPDAEQPREVAARLARLVIGGIHAEKLALPSMPEVVLKTLDILRNDHHNAAMLAEVLGGDPLVVPRVMKQANGANYAGLMPARTLEQAVARLGDRGLHAILVEFSARRLFESRNPAIRRAFRELWDHSVAVAVVARELGKLQRSANPELAYLAGLLHDVGKPVTGAVLLEAERIAKRPADKWHSPEAWLDVVSQCHREVGFALARAWHLPDEVLFAIARSDRYSLDDSLSPVNLVCLANAVVKRAGIYPQKVDDERVNALIAEGQRIFGVSDQTLVDALIPLRASNANIATVVAPRPT